MSNQFEIKIDNKDTLQDFLDFLVPDSNIDIIFSAPFGSGKTYFLENEFYNACKDAYNVFHLFPVNYSVSSNDDIFELIKFDLMQEFVVKYHKIIENDYTLGFSNALKLSFYLNQKFNFINFLNGISNKAYKLLNVKEFDVASDTTDVINFLTKEWEKIKSNSKVQTEGSIIDDYLKKFKQTSGIYDNDDYTKFVRSFLTKLKSINNNRKNILIIDDLDRIDPEHIFRLFNVFSSQRDSKSLEHKFGFDKVIFVCDIENIRNIYFHKYGENVDFWGYISKFISNRIYHFSYEDKLMNNISSFLRNMKYNRNSDFRIIDTSDSSNFYLLSFLITILIKLNVLKTRDILKVQDLYISDERFYETSNEFNKLILFLDKILGGNEEFRKAITKLSKRNQTFNLSNIGLQGRDKEHFLELLFRISSKVNESIDLELAQSSYKDVALQVKYIVRVQNGQNKRNYELIDNELGVWESFNVIKFLYEEINF